MLAHKTNYPTTSARRCCWSMTTTLFDAFSRAPWIVAVMP
jgi:hypothetical protein